jgi:Type II transport protein GspH
VEKSHRQPWRPFRWNGRETVGRTPMSSQHLSWIRPIGEIGAPTERGAALLDVIFTVGLVAVLSGIAIPTWHATREQRAARAGARFVAQRLQYVRLEALKRNVCVALRIDPDDLDRLGVFADGDGDGVLESDVARGIDVPLEPEFRLSNYTAVTLRLARDVPEPETGEFLAAGSDPLRIGRSALVSFSPLGTATSGTLYLAATTGPQMAVRILGATGRTRVLQFDPASRQWRDY